MSKHRTRTGIAAYLFAALLVTGSGHLSAADFYVALDGNDSTGDGSQARPWRTIQFALNTITGTVDEPHTVFIGPGRFEERLTFDWDDSFENLTGAGPEQTIIDAQGSGHGIFLWSASANTIQNMAITGGDITEGQYAAGGGLFCAGTNTLLKQLHIYGNRAKNHGGVFINSNGGEVAECWIHDNQATRTSGGIGVADDYPLYVHDNVIMNNSAELGGGFSAFLTTSLRFERNVVVGNFAAESGGGGRIYAAEGTFDGNLIENNRSALGTAGLTILESDPVITHNVIVNNTDGSHGVDCTDAFLTVGAFTHNTIVGNNGGLRLTQTGAATSHVVTIKHNVLWENGDDFDINLGGQPFDFSYNLIQDTGDENEGTGVVHDNPNFRDAGAGDFHVNSGSPVIDGGDPAWDFCKEPEPNGCIANLGCYGNTGEAEASLVVTCVPVNTCPPTPTIEPTPAPTNSATPEPTFTPTAQPTTPAASPTPSPSPAAAPELTLRINQNHFIGGDQFSVHCDLMNDTIGTVTAEFVAVLQVFDIFFFYPVWDQIFRNIEFSFGRGSAVTLTLLDVQLPDELPAGGPYSFHAALLNPELAGLMTPLSTVSFFFGN